MLIDYKMVLPDHLLRNILIQSRNPNILNLNIFRDLTNTEIFDILNAFVPSYDWKNKYTINDIEWITENINRSFNFDINYTLNEPRPFSVLLHFIPKLLNNIIFMSNFENTESYYKIIYKYYDKITCN